MAPPVRKLPANYELAVGGHKGHKVTKHKAEKPFKQRPSRLSTVSIFFKFIFVLNPLKENLQIKIKFRKINTLALYAI
jgi:hypothetical protein